MTRREPPRGKGPGGRDGRADGKGRAPSASGRTPGAGKRTSRSGVERPKQRRPAAAPKGEPLGPMRIQRALARSGVASRRAAETLIEEGRVEVNGERATIGQTVDPDRDAITVDGLRIKPPEGTADARWVVLHKPSGYMTTRSDPQGRPTVFELVRDHPGLTYVGRLDLLTEGVLLLTTDGEAAHLLTHPSREVERTYVAQVRGDADEAVERALEGVELEDGPVRARDAKARYLGRGRWEFEVTIAEGRNREIRRLCEALGLTVDKLLRTRFGPIDLGELPAGQSRALTMRERASLDRLLGRTKKHTRAAPRTR